MLRVVRGVAAAATWLFATVVLIVALILSITVVLLPLGVPLALLALRLYGVGVQLLAPRKREVKRQLRKSFGLRPRGSLGGDVKRARKSSRRSARQVGDRVREVSRVGRRRHGIASAIRRITTPARRRSTASSLPVRLFRGR